jgi:hypothetical protein
MREKYFRGNIFDRMSSMISIFVVLLQAFSITTNIEGYCDQLGLETYSPRDIVTT